MSATTCRKEVRGEDRVKKPKRMLFIDDTDVDTDDVPTDLEEEDRAMEQKRRRPAAKKAHCIVDEGPTEDANPLDDLWQWTDEDVAFVRAFLEEREELELAQMAANAPQTAEASPTKTPSTALLLGGPDLNETPELFPLKPEVSPESSSVQTEVRDRSVTFKWTVEGKSCEISVKL